MVIIMPIPTYPNRHLYSYTLKRLSESYPAQNGTFVYTNAVLLNSSRDPGPNFVDWKDRIRRKQTATTSFSARKVLFEKVAPAYVLVEDVEKVGNGPSFKNRYELTGFYPSFGVDGLVNSTMITEASNQALMRLNSSISEARSSFKGLTALGELREAIRMIRRPAAALRDGFNDYFRLLKNRRHHYSPGSRREQKWLSGTYLEATFGWQPLIADTQNAAIAASRIINDNFGYNNVDIRGVGVNERDFGLSAEFSNNLDIFGRNSYAYKQQKFARAIVVYDGELLLRSDPIDRTSAVSQLGFEFREFIPTVWNLLPWSFVVDYFTNVGDLMEALCNVGVQPAWLRKTVVQESYCRAVAPRLVQTGYGGAFKLTNTVFSPGTFVANDKQIGRSDATYSNLIPTFRIEIPGMGRKWLNLGALMSNQGKSLYTL